MPERVLILAAHPDDETLSCGATIAKHVRSGDALSIVVFADGIGARGFSPALVQERHGMYRRACKILGTEDVWAHQYADNQMDTLALLQVTQHVEKHLERFKPTIVYTHWKNDMNVDHRVVSEAVHVACRPYPGQTVKRILMFEVVSSTEWGGGFEPNWSVDVEDTLQTKLDALMEYEKEMREWPHARSMDNVRMLARVRGAGVGVKAAEAFVLSRGLQ